MPALTALMPTKRMFSRDGMSSAPYRVSIEDDGPAPGSTLLQKILQAEHRAPPRHAGSEGGFPSPKAVLGTTEHIDVSSAHHGVMMRVKVREAKLDPSLRDFFEQVGEQIVALALAVEATRGNGVHMTPIAP